MPWVRISDDFIDHPKLRDLSAAAVAMWVAGIAYANRNLTDGVIPARIPAGLIVTDGLYERSGSRAYRELTPSTVVCELIAHDLWHDLHANCTACRVPTTSSEYVIHDYLDYQPSREKVQVEREKTRLRVQRHRGRGPDAEQAGNAVTSPATNGRVTDAPKSQSQELPRHTASGHDSYAAEGVTDSHPSTPFLERLAAQYGLTDVPEIVRSVATATGQTIDGDRAIGLARWILDKSPQPPRAPQRYVIAAIERSPAEVDQHLYGGAA